FDESPVPKFTVVNHISETERLSGQTIENTSYPKSGDKNPIVTLGIADVKSGSVTFVDTTNYKPEDFIIARVGWSGDSKRVLFQAQNREQTFLDLNATDKATNKTVTLFKETSPAWVEAIDNAKFLQNGNFLWLSAARTGFKHLYLFDGNGKLLKTLTSGKWEIRSFHGVDEKNGFAYFNATEHSPIAEQIYRVKLDGSNFQRLSKEEGSHSAQFNEDFTQYIDNHSSINTPPNVKTYNADGTLIKIIGESKLNAQDKIGKPELLQVKTRDGFTMEAMMIKPSNFDATKKYPVMSYTYSGPHAQSVKNVWRGDLESWLLELPQKGYIIWVCDNRTASGKGVESEYPVYKNFGESELKDLTDGINYLKSLPYVDSTRIGLYGWSYGGYMTSYAMTHSDVFKVGIAGGTVADWNLYDSIYTERYMRTPQNNPEGYAKSSVVKAAKNLKGKLLLVHGTIDDNVHLQNSMQLVYELQKADKPFQMMFYPTARHGVSNPLQVRHLYKTMTDFILANL
ncbi:MAG: DPP IV N-terminal domain-containing protein, partial [Pyrinomonadaceae bacterium]|nr:DPP IV N-terminal domain-containing protein [Pyrinomonadaceae bacterium]